MVIHFLLENLIPEHLFSTITKTKKFNNIQGIFIGDSKFDFMCAQMQIGLAYYFLKDTAM